MQAQIDKQLDNVRRALAYLEQHADWFKERPLSAAHLSAMSVLDYVYGRLWAVGIKEDWLANTPKLRAWYDELRSIPSSSRPCRRWVGLRAEGRTAQLSRAPWAIQRLNKSRSATESNGESCGIDVPQVPSVHCASSMHWSPSILCIKKLFAGSPGVTIAMLGKARDGRPTMSAWIFAASLPR